MTVYWLVFLSVAFFAFLSNKRTISPTGFYSNHITPSWLIVYLLLVVYVGGRWFVGGDFAGYKYIYFGVVEKGFAHGSSTDPSFTLLNIIAEKLNIGFIGVNFIAGSIFLYGLVKYCRFLPRPFLALMVAIPYMVNIVGMGYMRQSIALGLSLLALIALIEKKNIKFFFIILAAATFHKSSIIFFSLAIFVSTKNRFFLIVASILMLLIGYVAFIEASLSDVVNNYLLTGMSSSGALVRVAMIILPALIFLYFRGYFKISEQEKKLWTLFSLASFPALFGVLFLDISTTIDRFALYALPLQLFVFSHLPGIFKKKHLQQLSILGIFIYYALVLYVWLNFANNASAWVPYKSMLRMFWDNTSYFENINLT